MRKVESQGDLIARWSVLSLMVLVSPFILTIVGVPLLYSVWIEEMVKLVAIVLGLERVKKGGIYWAALVGGLFGASESALFLLNINVFGNLGPLVSRWVFTIPMHIVTALVVYGFGVRNRFLLFLGYIIAVVIHYGFNVLVARWGLSLSLLAQG